MAEETSTANTSVPFAILAGVGGSAVAGFALVLSLLFSIQVSAEPKHCMSASGAAYWQYLVVLVRPPAYLACCTETAAGL